MALTTIELNAVVSEVIRSGVRWADLPPPVAALLGARHLLVDRSERERALIHGIAMARFTGIIPNRKTPAPQRTRWARLRRDPLHLTLTGASVRQLATVPLADGHALLAGMSADAVRLWDPWNGDLVGREIVPGHPVTSMTGVPWSGGRTVLAVAVGRLVTFWDPLNAEVAAEPMEFLRDIAGIAALSLPEGRSVLAVADGSKNGLIHLIDPTTGARVANPVQDVYSVQSVTTVRHEGRTLFAIQDADRGDFRLHDPMTGRAAGVMARADVGTVEVSGPDGVKLLAQSGSARGVIVLSEADSGARVGVLCGGHMAAVRAMVALPLPDGRTLLASAAADATVRLWDPASGYATYPDSRFAEFPSAAGRMVTAPVENRTVLAVGTRTQTFVQLWDGDTGAAAGEPLRCDSGGIRPETAAPIADGRTLIATAHEDNELRFWDPATSRVVYRTMPNYGLISAVTAVPLPDGRTVPATACSRQVVVWDDLDTSSTRQFPTGPTSGIIGAMTAVPTPTGGSILAASVGWKKLTNTRIARWDPVTGRRFGDLAGYGSSLVHALAVIPGADGQYLLAAGDDRGFVRIWDPISGALLAGPFPGGSRRVFALAGTRLPDGSGVLACGSQAQRIRLWDMTGEPIGKPLAGHRAPVRLLATLPDGLLASWGEDSTLRLWDVGCGRQVGGPVPTGSVTVTALAAVEDWRVVTGAADGTVQIWDLATGAAVGAPMRGHTRSITSVVSMPTASGGMQVISTDRAGLLWQWDPDTGAGHCRTTDFGTSPTAVPMPGGGALMASSQPFAIQTWDPATGQPVAKIDTRFPSDSNKVALSGPEGRPLLAHGSYRYGGTKALVYDLVSGAQHSGPFSIVCDGLTQHITQLAAVPGPEGHDLLACGGRQGAIQVWDPLSGTAIGEPLTGHGYVAALSALRVPGATVLASAGTREDSELADALRLWDVATGACLIALELDTRILALTSWDNRLAVHCDNGILVLQFDQLG